MSYNRNNIKKHLLKFKSESKKNNQQIAKEAEVDYNTIIKLTTGVSTNPTIRTMIGLAKAFNTTIEAFLL